MIQNKTKREYTLFWFVCIYHFRDPTKTLTQSSPYACRSFLSSEKAHPLSFEKRCALCVCVCGYHWKNDSFCQVNSLSFTMYACKAAISCSMTLFFCRCKVSSRLSARRSCSRSRSSAACSAVASAFARATFRRLFLAHSAFRSRSQIFLHSLQYFWLMYAYQSVL